MSLNANDGTPDLSLDGKSLKNVTAVWTRIENDFFHDLLLPEEVNFTFRQNPLK